MMKPEQLNFEDGYRGRWHCRSFPAKSPSVGEIPDLFFLHYVSLI